MVSQEYSEYNFKENVSACRIIEIRICILSVFLKIATRQTMY